MQVVGGASDILLSLLHLSINFIAIDIEYLPVLLSKQIFGIVEILVKSFILPLSTLLDDAL